MFLRADRLRCHPAAFIAMTGLTPVEFDALVGDLWEPYRAAERARRERPDRTHAIGVGHPFNLAPQEQMLLTMVWLGLYPTMEVLGFLFTVSELAVVIDSLEQRVQRSQERTEADRHYPGKKKIHTRKSQVAVTQHDGCLIDIGPSVRGPTADSTLLTRSGLLDRLDPDTLLCGDKAYHKLRSQ